MSLGVKTIYHFLFTMSGWASQMGTSRRYAECICQVRYIHTPEGTKLQLYRLACPAAERTIAAHHQSPLRTNMGNHTRFKKQHAPIVVLVQPMPASRTSMDGTQLVSSTRRGPDGRRSATRSSGTRNATPAAPSSFATDQLGLPPIQPPPSIQSNYLVQYRFESPLVHHLFSSPLHAIALRTYSSPSPSPSPHVR
jgi:hypothetical protein